MIDIQNADTDSMSGVLSELQDAVKAFNPPEFMPGPEVYTRGDARQYFCGLLAASLIEKKPALVIDLREELARRPYCCRGADLIEKTLEGDEPINELLRLLRSTSSRGQMARSVFPWFTIAPKKTWENAVKFGDQISIEGWCKVKDFGDE